LPTTSGALKVVDYEEKQKPTKKLGKNQKIVKETIESLHFNKVAEAQKEGKDIAHIRVSVDELHEQLKGKLKGNVSDIRKKALEALINNEEIGGNDETGYIPADVQQF